MKKSKAKELIKGINYHIEKAQELKREFNKLMDIKPLPFDTLQKLELSEYFPKKKKQTFTEDDSNELIEMSEELMEHQFDNSDN